jgi:receptor-type tyrosine-protein phosphatase N
VCVGYRYWPAEGMEAFGAFEVHLVSEHIVCDDYLVRNFYLKNVVTNETRTITQFHFLTWTEYTVPAIRSLIEFRRKVIKSHHHGKSKPIVVHCSDGCGRTGSYCLVDLVLNRIAKGTVKEVDVGATVEHLRDQRIGMVKTKKQFEFALMAIAEEMNGVLKALAAAQQKT